MRITKEPEERKKEIIEAAMELFKENGYKNTSISDIAKKLNISHGLLHYHFKCKDEVLAEVIVLNNQNIIEKLNFEELFKGNINAIAKINILMSTVLFNLEGKTEIIKESINVNGTQFIDNIAYKSLDIIVMKLIQFIKEGNEEGVFKCEYPKETAGMAVYGLERQFRKESEEDSTIKGLILSEYVVLKKEKYLTIFMNMLGMKEPMGLLEYETIENKY